MPKVTPAEIRAMKARGQKIAALTAYDFPMARLLDQVGIPFILVVGSSRVDLQACKLEYSIVSPK